MLRVRARLVSGHLAEARSADSVGVLGYLHACVLALWPKLTSTGYIFIDACVELNYCALFCSETW
jgi:hypothetical protein